MKGNGKTKGQSNTLPGPSTLDNPTKALARYGGQLQTLLWHKLVGQLTAEQRDLLRICLKLRRLNDATQTDPAHIYEQPETNLTHGYILDYVRRAEWLLTGANWRKMQADDSAHEQFAADHGSRIAKGNV